MLHWLVNGRVLDPGKEGGENRVTANQRIAGYLFQVISNININIDQRIAGYLFEVMSNSNNNINQRIAGYLFEVITNHINLPVLDNGAVQRWYDGLPSGKPGMIMAVPILWWRKKFASTLFNCNSIQQRYLQGQLNVRSLSLGDSGNQAYLKVLIKKNQLSLQELLHHYYLSLLFSSPRQLQLSPLLHHTRYGGDSHNHRFSSNYLCSSCWCWYSTLSGSSKETFQRRSRPGCSCITATRPRARGVQDNSASAAQSSSPGLPSTLNETNATTTNEPQQVEHELEKQAIQLQLHKLCHNSLLDCL